MNIRDLIRKFEDGHLKENEFHHREHLLITAWYLKEYAELDAILRIKHGIMKYNLIFGVPQSGDGGYHESITMFFIHLVKRGIENHPDLEIEPLIDKVFEGVNSKTMLRKYYTRERLLDLKARKFWIEPDLKKL